MKKMKIKIDDAFKDKTVFEGSYEYIENITEDSKKPSFFVSVSNKKKGESGNYEVYFYFETKEELEKFIKNLEEIKKT